MFNPSEPKADQFELRDEEVEEFARIMKGTWNGKRRDEGDRDQSSQVSDRVDPSKSGHNGRSPDLDV